MLFISVIIINLTRCVKCVGGLFSLAQQKELSSYHLEDRSLPAPTVYPPSSWDWSSPSAALKSLFVTGDWGAESAQALLDDDEVYGDFEDLESGEKGEHKGSLEGGGIEGEEAEDKRLEKKRKLKEAFNAGYDEEEGGGYLEELKREVSEQEQRNREAFDGMDEGTRQQLEGIRPGHYVRIVLKSKGRVFLGEGVVVWFGCCCWFGLVWFFLLFFWFGLVFFCLVCLFGWLVLFCFY